MAKERQESDCLKGVSGKVIVDKKGIKDSLKEYMERVMNEENVRNHRISAGVKERAADCFRVNEVVSDSSRNDTTQRGY